MRTPESFLRRRLGEVTTVTVADQQVDLVDEVAIPAGDLEPAIHEQAERTAAWGVILGRLKRRVERCQDELEELRADRFRQYWASLEEKERDEMVAQHHDEVDRDEFGRKRRVRARVERGVTAVQGRWRRNFSDDLVWSYVNSDEDITRARKALRAAKAELDIAYAVRDALDHRMRCLSHLCAIQRDNAKH